MDLLKELLGKQHEHARKEKHGYGHKQSGQHEERDHHGHDDRRHLQQHSWGNEHAPYNRENHRQHPGAGLMALAIQHKIIIACLLAVVLLLLAVALVLLLPMVSGLLGFVEKSGLKGILDNVIQLLSTVWVGTGK